jgi:arylsulfatase
LSVEGTVADSHPMAHSLPISIMRCETFNVGHDTGTPVDDADYQVPFPFTGKIIKLTVKLGPEELSAEEKGVIHKTFRDKQ